MLRPSPRIKPEFNDPNAKSRRWVWAKYSHAKSRCCFGAQHLDIYIKALMAGLSPKCFAPTKILVINSQARFYRRLTGCDNTDGACALRVPSRSILQRQDWLDIDLIYHPKISPKKPSTPFPKLSQAPGLLCLPHPPATASNSLSANSPEVSD